MSDIGDALRVDIGKFLSNYGSLANPISSVITGSDDYKKVPTNVLRLSNKDDVNYALWNTLGTMSWLVPAVGLTAYLSNRRKHKKIKEKVNKNTLAHVNADYPVLSPEGDLTVTHNITKRPRKEIEEISEALGMLPKISAAPGEKQETTTDLLSSAVARSFPLMAAPLATLLTVKLVNDHLKSSYEAELNEENRKLQNLQDAVDIRTLEAMKYIKKRPIKKQAGAVGDGVDMLKSYFLNIPIATLLTAVSGGTIYGIHHFLKKQDDMKKLKFLEERAIGRNRTLKGPELLVELPEGYEENVDKKRQEQLIPGIEESEDQENSKKDAFLG